jgi:hypothetical protein
MDNAIGFTIQLGKIGIRVPPIHTPHLNVRNSGRLRPIPENEPNIFIILERRHLRTHPSALHVPPSFSIRER